jgi:branched-chain amino acid transport system ATP-binding protein
VADADADADAVTDDVVDGLGRGRDPARRRSRPVRQAAVKGTVRRLEIARAMATEPRLLMLDEPAAGMNPAETHEITELIGRLRTEAGYAILVIEHDMHVVEGISDRVIALDHGVKIAEGDFESVAEDPNVIEAYLGYGAAETK